MKMWLKSGKKSRRFEKSSSRRPLARSEIIVKEACNCHLFMFYTLMNIDASYAIASKCVSIVDRTVEEIIPQTYDHRIHANGYCVYQIPVSCMVRRKGHSAMPDLSLYQYL